MDYNILGDNIRKARKSANITQEKLAEYIDMSTVFVCQIETGARKPSLETIYKISNTLKISVDDLLKNTVEHDMPIYHDELNMLLENRSSIEINFIVSIVRKILENLQDGKIVPKN